MIARRLAGGVLTIAGAAGLTACVLAAFTGMRDIMRTSGGSCASGGPYVSVHPCSGADMRLLMVGIFGGLAALAVYTAGTSALGRSAALSGLLAWAALFGTLGWNFIDTYRHSPHAAGAVAFLSTGWAFWLMALGGLVLFLFAVARDLRHAGRPDPAMAGMQPLVMVASIPGVPVPVPLGGPWSLGGTGGWALGGGLMPAMTADLSARRRELLQVGLWLGDSVAGAAAGITLSASLITLLR
jgi:hypothetical protein